MMILFWFFGEKEEVVKVDDWGRELTCCHCKEAHNLIKCQYADCDHYMCGSSFFRSAHYNESYLRGIGIKLWCKCHKPLKLT